MGAYISSQQGEEMIYESVSRLVPYFDIALVTHSTVSERIQSKVKYFIYDHRNEVMTKDVGTVYWGNYPTFYYEIHPNGLRKYYSFAIYRSLTNAVKMLCEEYDSFIYIEGDVHFSPEDAIKLRDMKKVASENGKKSMFISYGEHLCSNFFYSEMDFFKRTFGYLKSSDEYTQRCSQIGSHGQLENFLYRSIAYNNAFGNAHILDLMNKPGYFPTSVGGLSQASGRADNIPLSFTSEVFRLQGTDELVFMYISYDKKPNTPDHLALKLDEEIIMQLPTYTFSTAFKINPKNEKFLIEIGSNKFYYDKNQILSESNKSFIKLK